MKKLIAVLLSVSIIMGMSVSAFAAPNPSPETRIETTYYTEASNDFETDSEVTTHEVSKDVLDVVIEENISEEYFTFAHPVFDWERSDLVITTETITTTTMGEEITVFTTTSKTVVPVATTTDYEAITVRKVNNEKIESQVVNELKSTVVYGEPLVSTEMTTEVIMDVDKSVVTETNTITEEGNWTNWFNPGRAKASFNFKK